MICCCFSFAKSDSVHVKGPVFLLTEWNHREKNAVFCYRTFLLGKFLKGALRHKYRTRVSVTRDWSQTGLLSYWVIRNKVRCMPKCEPLSAASSHYLSSCCHLNHPHSSDIFQTPCVMFLAMWVPYVWPRATGSGFSQKFALSLQRLDHPACCAYVIEK